MRLVLSDRDHRTSFNADCFLPRFGGALLLRPTTRTAVAPSNFNATVAMDDEAMRQRGE